MNVEDALKFLVQCLRTRRESPDIRSGGYDLHVRKVMGLYVLEVIPQQQRKPYCGNLPPIAPFFLEAAWELCRRGILRPGVTNVGELGTPEGSAGMGYSITQFGRTWLSEADRDDFVPTEPERFGRLLEPFRAKFGPGFHQRAQEAIRCYGAHAYLACCAMCGAAAESILLKVAAQLKDEAEVLKDYRSSGGRGRIENLIVGRATQHLRREFFGFTPLLNYWRDVAGHGSVAVISDDEAFTSIALLLRFAQFVSDRWNELTAGTP